MNVKDGVQTSTDKDQNIKATDHTWYYRWSAYTLIRSLLLILNLHANLAPAVPGFFGKNLANKSNRLFLQRNKWSTQVRAKTSIHKGTQ